MKNILFIILLFTVNTLAQIPIPETGCYHAAFIGNDNHPTFETLSGKNIAIEMFFTGWPTTSTTPDFPLTNDTPKWVSIKCGNKVVLKNKRP